MSDEPSFDVAGMVRRVRRRLDLSQRDLAERLEVAHSTVARWESGERDIRSTDLVRLLALAELRLEVRDDEDEVVAPMHGADAVRDRGGRQLPAHLDAEARCTSMALFDNPGWCWARVPRRPLRDRLREAGRLQNGDQHPTLEEVTEARARARGRIQEPVLRRAQLRRERSAAERPPVPCFCPLECEEVHGCLPECPCACEPRVPEWATPWTRGGRKLR
ncbi:helix-turn-helix transcriptional regulator [Naumannella sp. ID2617S]|nr:helix-turn-helix transcriptional regulator [Naumannella sp. ID2617S]